MPSEAEKAARRELRRMRSMNPAGAEYQVARNYVEWVSDLPWSKSSAVRLDVNEARRVLDEDHHGLDKIKKRILEFIAVRKLRSDIRGPILCFVGPPAEGDPHEGPAGGPGDAAAEAGLADPGRAGQTENDPQGISLL